MKMDKIIIWDELRGIKRESNLTWNQLINEFPLSHTPQFYYKEKEYNNLSQDVFEMSMNIFFQDIFNFKDYFEKENEAFAIYSRISLDRFGERGKGYSYIWLSFALMEKAKEVIKENE